MLRKRIILLTIFSIIFTIVFPKVVHAENDYKLIEDGEQLNFDITEWNGNKYNTNNINSDFTILAIHKNASQFTRKEIDKIKRTGESSGNKITTFELLIIDFKSLEELESYHDPEIENYAKSREGIIVSDEYLENIVKATTLRDKYYSLDGTYQLPLVVILDNTGRVIYISVGEVDEYIYKKIFTGDKSNDVVITSDKIKPCKLNTDVAWEYLKGHQYWYEFIDGDFYRQGTYGDKKNIIGDGSERGREIFDPCSDGWYWLDSIYNGAKAVDKEVWIPYIFQEEDTWIKNNQLDIIEQKANDSKNISWAPSKADMSKQVKEAILNKSGKWVRYDINGKMVKGWYQVMGRDVDFYNKQKGNIYYYDYQTGLMAKGDTVIDGKTYHFDEVTGVCKNPPRLSNANDDNQKLKEAKVIAKKIANRVRLDFEGYETNVTDWDKVFNAAYYVSRYCQNITYTSDDPDFKKAYGVFVKGVYTCQGSCEALGLVLTELGYNWQHVNKGQWTHQWLRLMLDGEMGYADGQAGIAGYGKHPVE